MTYRIVAKTVKIKITMTMLVVVKGSDLDCRGTTYPVSRYFLAVAGFYTHIKFIACGRLDRGGTEG